MASSTDNKPSVFNAAWWKGASWLAFLCVLFVILIVIYLVTHNRDHFGYEYVSLNTEQQKNFTDLVDIYSDDDSPTSVLLRDTTDVCGTGKTGAKPKYDKAVAIRTQKAGMIEAFLSTTFKGDVRDTSNREKSGNSTILADQLREIDPTLRELNNKDVIAFILGKKFKVDSFFWLAGTSMYWETIFWSLFGVFTSLIYYVSLANQLSLKNKGDDDIGPFDTSEISAQVAKMFYAPAVTLVFVLGYSFVSGQNKDAVDISVNHGLILFAFVAGFYSGRLMKLLDKLKNSFLPDSSDGPSKDDKPAGSNGDIAVTLKLSDAVANGPDGPGLLKAGLKTATVTLVPNGSAAAITLDKPTEDQGVVFKAGKVPFGKYMVQAVYTYGNEPTVLNLVASQDIQVAADALTFTLVLEQIKTG
jgi:hypothetical protein